MVRFSAKPKNEPHSPPSRERSEREMQKTLLGYAHPSYINRTTEGVIFPIFHTQNCCIFAY
ncbi:MAG: hypothetical protein U5L45_16960 [Saprospiraceae bacterium]|nr:hypothetical protein [Saprospiraceae bacterium]